jgi:hypothetical protein
MYSSTHSLTSTLDGGEWSTSRPGRSTPKERALANHWIGGWAGPRSGLDTVVKRKIPSPRQESNPRTPIVQPETQQNNFMFPFQMSRFFCSFMIRTSSTCFGQVFGTRYIRSKKRRDLFVSEINHHQKNENSERNHKESMFLPRECTFPFLYQQQ